MSWEVSVAISSIAVSTAGVIIAAIIKREARPSSTSGHRYAKREDVAAMAVRVDNLERHMSIIEANISGLRKEFDSDFRGFREEIIKLITQLSQNTRQDFQNLKQNVVQLIKER